MASENNSDSDTRSTTSSEMTDDEFEEFLEEVNPEHGVLPYQYEPQRGLPSCSLSSEEESEGGSDEENQGSRLTSSDWCKCGEVCQAMDRIEECVCCQEIAATTDMCSSLCNEGPEYVDQPPPQCITQHPGFAAVCLNKWVLRTAWHQYKQQYKESYEGPEHKQFRHIAYRQLARWCWGYLGKDVRVVLPSCAVMCIRAHFPPPGLEEHFIFEGFHYADE